MNGNWRKRQERCDERENVDKHAVDSGQVGERAKEALVDGLDGLDGLSMMLVLGVVFSGRMGCACGKGGEVCREEGAKGLDGQISNLLEYAG